MRCCKFVIAGWCSLAVLLVFADFSSAQQDWPKWLGAKGDGIWRDTGILSELPAEGPPMKWRVPIGSGYTGPSVADGRVFVMDRTKGPERPDEELQKLKKAAYLPGGERILCLDQETGEIIWEREYLCDYFKISYPSGPRCTPTVDGEFVYTLGTMGDLMCLRVADGEVVWQKRFGEFYTSKDQPARPPVWGYASHPVIDGPRLIVPVGGEGSALVAFDKLTGEELWKNLTSSDIAYAPLVIYSEGDSRQLLFWHADGIDSLNPETGEHFWHHKFPEEQTQPGATTSIMTPQIVGDLFYVSEYFSGSLLLKLKSDPPGVEELFRSTTDDPKHEHSMNSLMTTPVIRDGLVYCVTGDGTFRCTRLETGEMVWENKTFMSEEPADFATIFMVENEGRYFSLDDQGKLSIVALSEKGYEQLSQCQLIEATENARGRTVVWSHPAFANRCIIARNNKEIVCFDMTKPGE